MEYVSSGHYFWDITQVLLPSSYYDQYSSQLRYKGLAIFWFNGMGFFHFKLQNAYSKLKFVLPL
jgi:hypothetical protein